MNKLLGKRLGRLSDFIQFQREEVRNHSWIVNKYPRYMNRKQYKLYKKDPSILESYKRLVD